MQCQIRNSLGQYTCISQKQAKSSQTEYSEYNELEFTVSLSQSTTVHKYLYHYKAKLEFTVSLSQSTTVHKYLYHYKAKLEFTVSLSQSITVHKYLHHYKAVLMQGYMEIVFKYITPNTAPTHQLFNAATHTLIELLQSLMHVKVQPFKFS